MFGVLIFLLLLFAMFGFFAYVAYRDPAGIFKPKPKPVELPPTDGGETP